MIFCKCNGYRVLIIAKTKKTLRRVFFIYYVYLKLYERYFYNFSFQTFTTYFDEYFATNF